MAQFQVDSEQIQSSSAAVNASIQMQASRLFAQ